MTFLAMDLLFYVSKRFGILAFVLALVLARAFVFELPMSATSRPTQGNDPQSEPSSESSDSVEWRRLSHAAQLDKHSRQGGEESVH